MGIKRHSEPRPLQLSKRANVFYLEHARVVQQDDRIVYLTQDGGEFEQMFNIPERNTAFLLLGKGTSITDAAMRRMAASNVMVGRHRWAFAEREDRRCSVYATSLS